MRKAILCIILILLAASCTQHDGRIGPVFGKWQLKEVRYGSIVAAYDSVFYNFQGNLVRLERLSSEVPHTVKYDMGYFSHIGDELILDIRDCPLSRVEMYRLPDTTVNFKVLKLDNRNMELRLGEDSTYVFRKTGAIGRE